MEAGNTVSQDVQLLHHVLAFFACPAQQQYWQSSKAAPSIIQRIIAAQPRRRAALASTACPADPEHLHDELDAPLGPNTSWLPATPPSPATSKDRVHAPVPQGNLHQPRSSADTAETGAGSDNATALAAAHGPCAHAATPNTAPHIPHQQQHHDSSNGHRHTHQATGSRGSSRAQPQQATHHQLLAERPPSPQDAPQQHLTSHHPAAHSQASPPSPSPAPQPSPPPLTPQAPAAPNVQGRGRQAPKPKRKPKNADEFLRRQMSGIRRQKAANTASKGLVSGAGRGRGSKAAAQQQQHYKQNEAADATHKTPPYPPSANKGVSGLHAGPELGHIDRDETGSQEAAPERRSKRQRRQQHKEMEMHTGLTTSSSSSSSSSGSEGQGEEVERHGEEGGAGDSGVDEEITVNAQRAWGGGLVNAQPMQQQQHHVQIHSGQQQTQELLGQQDGEGMHKKGAAGAPGKEGLRSRQLQHLPQAHLHPPVPATSQTPASAAQPGPVTPAAGPAPAPTPAKPGVAALPGAHAAAHVGPTGIGAANAKAPPAAHTKPPAPPSRCLALPASNATAAQKHAAAAAAAAALAQPSEHAQDAGTGSSRCHVPIGLGAQGPTPGELAAAHQELLKQRAQQAEALERERLGLNMVRSSNQPMPPTKPQLQARRAQQQLLQQQQQQQQTSQQQVEVQPRSQYCLPPQQHATLSSAQQPQLHKPLAQQERSQQPQAQQPQSQQPPLQRQSELQRFRQQHQEGKERFGLFHKAGFKSYQPPRKGGAGRGAGLQGQTEQQAQTRQQGAGALRQAGQRAPQSGTQLGRQGQQADGFGRGQDKQSHQGPPCTKQVSDRAPDTGFAGTIPAAAAAAAVDPQSLVRDPRLLRTLHRYQQRTHDAACADAAELRAANQAWADAMAEGADELEAELPAKVARPVYQQGREGQQQQQQQGTAQGDAQQQSTVWQQHVPSSSEPTQMQQQTQQTQQQQPQLQLCQRNQQLSPSKQQSIQAAQQQPPPKLQEQQQHSDNAEAHVGDGDHRVNSRDEGALPRSQQISKDGKGSDSEGNDKEGEEMEGGGGSSKGLRAGREPARLPHKRVLNLCKGQPGQSSHTSTTVVELGLFADIRAHGKEGKKRRKEVYQFAQEHPELAQPSKKRRPTYELQQMTCRFWRLGICSRADCTFKHEGEPTPKRLVPCEFHGKGACKHGADCNFSHVADQPCKVLILEGACHDSDACPLKHDYSPADLHLLHEYYSKQEGRKQKAAAAWANSAPASVPSAHVTHLAQAEEVAAASSHLHGPAADVPLLQSNGLEVEEF